LPAFNCSSFSTINAIMEAARDFKTPVIIQVLMSHPKLSPEFPMPMPNQYYLLDVYQGIKKGENADNICQLKKMNHIKNSYDFRVNLFVSN